MRLLASVVSAQEAVCIADIADLIDVKNPSIGALGAPDLSTVASVRSHISADTPLSATVGDLDGLRTVDLARRMVQAGVNVVKTGLGDIKPPDAIMALIRLKKSLPQQTMVVAAAYADAGELGLFPVSALPHAARQAGIDGILVDTNTKDGRTLFDFIPPRIVLDHVEKGRHYGLMTALAGSLGIDEIETLAAISPDWAGFRTAITNDGKRGREGVSRRKTALLKSRLTTTPGIGKVVSL